MQLTLTVPDAKADAFLDVLRHISYVEIASSDVCDNSCSAHEDDDAEEKISAEEFYEGLRGAIHEVNEIIAGRKKGRPVEELLAELRSSDVV